MLPTRGPDIATNSKEDNLVAYLLVSSAVLLVYDYLLTLDLERDLVWLASLSWMKILYLVQRYLPFFDTAVLLSIGIFQPNLTSGYCFSVINASNWMHLFGVSLSEILLTTRAWAACKNRFRRINSILFAFSALCFIPILVITGLFFRTVQFVTPSPAQNAPRGCFLVNRHHLFSIWFGFFLLYDAVILALILIPGFSAFKQRKYSMYFDVVYRDGVLFNCYLLVLGTLNIILILALPARLGYIIMPMLRVIHSIIASRTVLHIRERMSKNSVDFINGDIHLTDLSTEVGDLNFARPSSELDAGEGSIVCVRD